LTVKREEEREERKKCGMPTRSANRGVRRDK